MFVIAIPLALIFSYFWAVIIYRLFGTDSKRDKIIRAVIYIAVAFLVFGGWGVLMDICIFFWIRDFKKKTSYYHAKHLLGKVAFGLSIPVFAFSAWQTTIPQRIIVNLVPPIINIENNDFRYLKNPKDFVSLLEKNNIEFEFTEKLELLLGFALVKNNLYFCDDFGCKGDKKYGGYVWFIAAEGTDLSCFHIEGAEICAFRPRPFFSVTDYIWLYSKLNN